MKALQNLINPILRNNPITVQILGLCSVLAVTQSLLPALIMAAAVTGVLAFSNLMISLLRHAMPASIRLILEMSIIASSVIVADEIIKTFAPEISQVLSVFVGLIVTNCIVLGRSESFALNNSPGLSLLDGIGNGIGYSLILILIAGFREIVGHGTLLNEVFLVKISEGGWYLENKFMASPASAFFLLGLVVWLIQSYQTKTNLQINTGSTISADKNMSSKS